MSKSYPSAHEEQYVITRDTNGYDLLDRIKVLIKESPGRIRMESFRISLENMSQWTRERGPRCGTIGCIGGWINILQGHSEFHGSPNLEAWGLPGYDVYHLFYGIFPIVPYGSEAYADEVIEHITKFQRKHEKKLRTAIVKAPDRE